MNFNFTVYPGVTFVDVLIALLILIVGVLLAKVISIRIRRLLKDKVSVGPREIASKGSYYIIMIFAVLVALQKLGIELEGLLLVGGLLAIAIGFASQSVISNLISGLFLSFDRPMNVGDAVDIDGTAGVVEEVRVMSTRMRTFDGKYVRLPNAKVFNSNITNFNTCITRRFEYQIGIRYKDDTEHAKRIIEDLIDAHPLTLVNPAPQVFVDNLGDNSVDFKIWIWSPSSEWWGVKKELLAKIKTALEENGIQIPFPQREVWLKEGLPTES